jgi:putative membrane protein
MFDREKFWTRYCMRRRSLLPSIQAKTGAPYLLTTAVAPHGRPRAHGRATRRATACIVPPPPGLACAPNLTANGTMGRCPPAPMTSGGVLLLRSAAAPPPRMMSRLCSTAVTHMSTRSSRCVMAAMSGRRAAVFGSRRWRASMSTNPDPCGSGFLSPAPKPDPAEPPTTAAAAAAIAARQPQPDPRDSSRALYRPGLPKSLGDRLVGRWRGQPIDLNHSHQMWARRDAATRHVGLLLSTMRSETFRRLLFPDIAVTCAVSSAVVAHNLWVAWENAHNVFPVEQSGFNLLLHHDMVSLPPEPLSLSAFALGLILAFRTNTSHARYVEARKCMGRIINLSRAVASGMTANPTPRTEAAQRSQRRAVALVSTFAHTVKYHLTVDGCNQHIDASDTAQITQALREELLVVWRMSDDDDDGHGGGGGSESDLWQRGAAGYIEAILGADVPNRPLHVLHELQRLTHCESLGLDPVAKAQIGERLLVLMDALGGCERILRTPIYTPYTHHLSRFLFLWCCSVPLAMYPIVGPVGTVPVSAAVSFFMLGIEDIGVRIEQPFDSLPLWQYVEAIDSSCGQILAHNKL